METPDTQLLQEPCRGTLEQGGKHVAQAVAAAATKKKNLLDKRGVVLSLFSYFLVLSKIQKTKMSSVVQSDGHLVWV